MRKWLSGIVLLLLSAPLLAAVSQGEEGGGPPSEPVDVIWVVVFAVIFFGMIGYFFWYLWQNERKRTPEE